VFWEDDEGRFLPLAIQLKPADVEAHNPVITPLHKPGDWQMARAHVSCADGTLHEGYYHLLETHLVNEAVALCMYRRLHPDHPLRQLLTPHYQGTLAINAVARGHLLSTEGSGGPIQRSMAGGVAGTLNAACLAYRDWSFPARGLEADLAARGMNKLRNYHYRDDARAIHGALGQFVRELLGLWYQTDADVAEDFELQDFLREVGSPEGGAIPGFPGPADGESVGTRIDARDKLFALVTDLIFRAGPQHAAVNNGQFDTYGEVANGPGRLHGDLPSEVSLDEAHFTEADFWRRLPAQETAIAQMSMVWVLSLPTRRSILQTGQFPELNPLLSIGAVEAIATLRRELQSISYYIQARNATLAVPYRYLDPANVSLSTDV
jgi:arachidonate 15-lipoxygenase